MGTRVVGIILSPRLTYEAILRDPRWLGVLILCFLVDASARALLLETEIGQLALLDQWERTADAFGRGITDAEYAAMDAASRNGAAYGVATAFLGGPVLVFALSGLLFALFRSRAPSSVTYPRVLAVVTYASVILALREVIGAPVSYARETLASPATLALFFAVVDEASPFARFFSIIDLFVIWWIAVLALGMGLLVQRPARRLAGVFVGAYVTLAVILTAAMAAAGGTA